MNEFEQLYENLFAVIDYPGELAYQVREVAELWKEFCALPTETKLLFVIPEVNGFDPGYVLRKKEHGYDNKEYYHFPRHHDRLVVDALEKSLKSTTVPQRFFEACNDLIYSVEKFAMGIGEKVSQQYPELNNLSKHIQRGFETQDSLLRFLHYMPRPDDSEILAEPHFDRGGMTFHLFENHEGLQFMNWDKTWHDAPMQGGKTVLFNAYGLERLSQGILQATWHRVIRDTTEKDRYSAVYFCDFPDVPVWDSEKMGPTKLQPQEYKEKRLLS